MIDEDFIFTCPTCGRKHSPDTWALKSEVCSHVLFAVGEIVGEDVTFFFVREEFARPYITRLPMSDQGARHTTEWDEANKPRKKYLEDTFILGKFHPLDKVSTGIPFDIFEAATIIKFLGGDIDEGYDEPSGDVLYVGYSLQ